MADKDNHRVQMFNEDGTFLSRFGSMGDGPRQLNHRQHFYIKTRIY